MSRNGNRVARALLGGLLLALPAMAVTPPSFNNDADENALELRPLDTARPALAEPRAPSKPAAAAVATPKQAPMVSANPLWEVPLSTLSATRDRPLFSPTRRPPEPPAANVPVVAVRAAPPPPPPAPEHPNLTLVGTVAAERGAVAVFIDQGTRATVRLHTGEGHMGWVLQSVERSVATLQKGDRTETLELPRPRVDGSPAPPVTSAIPAVLPAALPPPPAPPAAARGPAPAQVEGCMPEPIGC
jgi:general secretion pathway protein N